MTKNHQKTPNLGYSDSPKRKILTSKWPKSTLSEKQEYSKVYSPQKIEKGLLYLQKTFDSHWELTLDTGTNKKIIKKRGYDNLPRPPFKVASSFLVVPENLVDTTPRYVSEKYNNNFVTYLNSRRRYPENAERLGLHGPVKLSYVVEPSGIISNVKVLQSLGGGCTEEAVRLMRDTRWLPGQKADLAVRTEMQVVIKF